MTTKLENKLFKEFKEFFEYAKTKKGSPIIPITFGCECGDGWYFILYHLLKCIKNYAKNNKYSDGTPIKFRLTQIKEKYGTLRVYCDGADDFIEGMIWFAEHLSWFTCERCGSTKDVGSTKGWIKVRCRKCIIKEKELKRWKSNLK